MRLIRNVLKALKEFHSRSGILLELSTCVLSVHIVCLDSTCMGITCEVCQPDENIGRKSAPSICQLQRRIGHWWDSDLDPSHACNVIEGQGQQVRH